MRVVVAPEAAAAEIAQASAVPVTRLLPLHHSLLHLLGLLQLQGSRGCLLRRNREARSSAAGSRLSGGVSTISRSAPAVQQSLQILRKPNVCARSRLQTVARQPNTSDILFRNSAGDTWFVAMSNGNFNGWQHVGGSDTHYAVPPNAGPPAL
jgi:hypothetical protein